MISRFLQLLFRNPARIKRGLALVLLASLSWAATVELTHRHRAQSSSQFGETEFAADETAFPRVESSSKDASSGAVLSSSECSICQVHQNLFASLFTHTPDISPATTPLLGKPAAQISYFSSFKTPQQGRAPPINL